MAITRTQSITAVAGAVETISATLAAKPKRRAILVAIVATRGAVTISGQSNLWWVKYATQQSTNLTMSVFYLVDAPRGTATYTFTWVGAQKATLHLIEYAGAEVRRSPFDATSDGTTSATATSATAGASTSTSTTDPADVMVTGHTAVGSATFSLPTNGFSFVGSTIESTGGAPGSHNSTIAAEKIATVTGTFFSQATISASSEWVSCHIALQSDKRTGVARRVKYFSYDGDGNTGDVFSAMGFYPDVLLLLPSAGASYQYLRLVGMETTSTLFEGENLNVGAGDNQLSQTNSDGFVIGAASGLNPPGAKVYGLAIQVESAPANLEYGSEYGDGTIQSVACGFQPDGVICAIRGPSTVGWLSTKDHIATHSTSLADGTDSTAVIQSLTATGFTLQTTSTIRFHWLAFKIDSSTTGEGAVGEGTYTGDGTGNRNITVALGFSPEFILDVEAPAAGTQVPYYRNEAMGAGLSLSANANLDSTHITGTHVDGFTVASGSNVNTRKYYYFCLGASLVTLIDSTPVGGKLLPVLGAGQ